MIATDAVRELFAKPLVRATGLRPLAEGLLAIAQNVGSVELPVTPRQLNTGLLARLLYQGLSLNATPPSPPDTWADLAADPQPIYEGEPDLGGLSPRLFRPLLAFLAGLAAEESGAEFHPYHGRYTLTRVTPAGPVRLDIAIENTTGEQRLTITRSVVADLPNGAARPADPAPLDAARP